MLYIILRRVVWGGEKVHMEENKGSGEKFTEILDLDADLNPQERAELIALIKEMKKKD
jgi:hypothetical protein